MNDLPDFVLDAHIGLKRWSGVSTLTTELAAGGPFWGRQGFPDAFGDETLTVDVRRQHAAFTPWTAPGKRDAVLVDPLQTTGRARGLADWVAAHDRNLTAVYITQ